MRHHALQDDFFCLYFLQLMFKSSLLLCYIVHTHFNLFSVEKKQSNSGSFRCHPSIKPETDLNQNKK